MYGNVLGLGDGCSFFASCYIEMYHVFEMHLKYVLNISKCVLFIVIRLSLFHDVVSDNVTLMC